MSIAIEDAVTERRKVHVLEEQDLRRDDKDRFAHESPGSIIFWQTIRIEVAIR